MGGWESMMPPCQCAVRQAALVDDPEMPALWSLGERLALHGIDTDRPYTQRDCPAIPGHVYTQHAIGCPRARLVTRPRSEEPLVRVVFATVTSPEGQRTTGIHIRDSTGALVLVDPEAGLTWDPARWVWAQEQAGRVMRGLPVEPFQREGGPHG